jgi:hypothetical protein
MPGSGSGDFQNNLAPRARTGGRRMMYDKFFTDAISRLRDERRYRVFADLERIAGQFPWAVWHSP